MGVSILKWVFPVHWILHIRISRTTKFQLKLTIFIFWTKFAQKGYFRSETEKVNSTIEFCTWQFRLLDQIYSKSIHHHWILDILISLGSKLQLRLTFLIIFPLRIQQTLYNGSFILTSCPVLGYHFEYVILST